MIRKKSRTNDKNYRENLPFFAAEKRSRFLQGIPKIDFKDSELLKKFATEQGKILPRRICGLGYSSSTLSFSIFAPQRVIIYIPPGLRIYLQLYIL